MLGALESILFGVEAIPVLLANLLIDAFNSFIAGLAALAVAVIALLPGFPSPPEPPSGVVGGFLWLFPVAAIAAWLTTFMALWVAFLGFKVVLKWIRLL